MSHESRHDLLMFGRTLRLPPVRDAVTAYRQQGMTHGSTRESSWHSHVKGDCHHTLGCDPQVRTFIYPMPPFSFRTSVIFTPMFHADISYLLCNPSHASKALCPLFSHASYLFASLT